MPFLNSKIIRFIILLPSDKTLLDNISSPLMNGCRCMYREIYHIIIIIIITTTTTTDLNICFTFIVPCIVKLEKHYMLQYTLYQRLIVQEK